MKRYAAFAYDCYYPSGGWSDCVGMSDNIGEAVSFAHESKRDCQEVVDLTEGRIVWEGTGPTHNYTGPMARAVKESTESYIGGINSGYQGSTVKEWKPEP